MSYEGVEKKRLTQLLEWGADDDELKRFFFENRLLLIQKGAKVQNLPHGKAARVRTLATLPLPAYKVVQKWFSENLTMLDPISVGDLVTELRLYEEVGENPPQEDAKRLARSCLVHLFATDPPSELLTFLRPVQVAATADNADPHEVEAVPANGADQVDLPVALGKTLIALAEGQDPDELLASLPPTMASFVAGVHSVRSGRDEEAKVALEAFDGQHELHGLLREYATRKATARAGAAPRGIQLLRPSSPDEEFSFDFGRDEVIAVCTKDAPETAVFVKPIAIRAADGSWFDLSNDAYRKQLFYQSGDLIAFPGGRDAPRQPRRGEIGIWKVAENKASNPQHLTNFHIASEGIPVYEVREVPFNSLDYDAVREYIKDVFGERGAAAKSLLFLMRDQLVVGCPPGRDLTKDEGFEGGLPCWHKLPALRFENRTLVPGPLPHGELYECEALASSVKKLFAAGQWGSDKPTKKLSRRLQELLASSEPSLSAARMARLRAELSAIDEHQGAMATLMEEVMREPQVTSQVDSLVHAKVDALVAQREELRESIQQLEQQLGEIQEQRRRAEKEQKAIAPAVAKAIRSAFDNARADALGTLGQVSVFKTLIDELIERPEAPAIIARSSAAPTIPEASGLTVRPAATSAASVSEALRALGVAPKTAAALEAAGRMSFACGLPLIVDGIAARVAVETWVGSNKQAAMVLECGFGDVADCAIKSLLQSRPSRLAILDANLSPIEVYARPLLDALVRRLSGMDSGQFDMDVLMSAAEGPAALPFPAVVHSLSLRVSLDCLPEFVRDHDVAAWLEDAESMQESVGWAAKLWKPARLRVLGYLRTISTEEAALALAALEAAQA